MLDNKKKAPQYLERQLLGKPGTLEMEEGLVRKWNGWKICYYKHPFLHHSQLANITLLPSEHRRMKQSSCSSVWTRKKESEKRGGTLKARSSYCRPQIISQCIKDSFLVKNKIRLSTVTTFTQYTRGPSHNNQTRLTDKRHPNK